MVSSIAFEGLSSDLPSLSSDLSWRDASRRPNLVADFERDSGDDTKAAFKIRVAFFRTADPV